MKQSAWLFYCAALLGSSCAFLATAPTQPLTATEATAIQRVNGDSARIDEFLAQISDSKVDSFLLWHRQELLVERYFNGYDAMKTHDLRSATKAITALLVGIAIDQGFIESTQTSILEYFPEYRQSAANLAGINIEHLLTMTSGVDANDWHKKSPGNEERMYKTDSWVEFYFSLDAIAQPGEQFAYATAGVIVLGEIIKRASGLNLEQFAQRYLFAPLAIETYQFQKTPVGEIDSGGHLALTPQDFSKIALLVSSAGVWQGQQIVSKAWLAQMLTPHKPIFAHQPQGPFMGYLWWLEPIERGVVKSYQARGNGGQLLIVIPHLELIAVFTGSAYNDDAQRLPFALTAQYLIPAFNQNGVK